jgi:hypothetical protein
MPEINFNSDEIDPISGFDPLPVGEYLVIISNSEIKETKQKTGKYLQLTYDVIDGKYKNRKIFDRLNIINPSEDAQTIAQRALSAICHVTGVAHPRQTEELHDKPFIVKIGIRPASGEFSESNIVKGYKYKDGSTIDGKKPAPKNESGEEKKNKKPWEK